MSRRVPFFSPLPSLSCPRPNGADFASKRKSINSTYNGTHAAPLEKGAAACGKKKNKLIFLFREEEGTCTVRGQVEQRPLDTKQKLIIDTLSAALLQGQKS